MLIVNFACPLRPRYRATLNTKLFSLYIKKKKIQNFVRNMTFISIHEVKKLYISFVAIYVCLFQALLTLHATYIYSYCPYFKIKCLFETLACSNFKIYNHYKVPYCYLFLRSIFVLWFTYFVSDII